MEETTKPIVTGEESDLKELIQEYIDYVDSDEYHEDNDYMQYIYEETLEHFCGKDVFERINKRH